MARNHATLYSAIWSDPDFVALKASAQRMYLLLISQPDLNSCGVIAYRPKVWARLAPDLTVVNVVKDVRMLTERRFVLVDEATDELAVRSFMRHDGVLKAPNIFKAAARAYGTIHSPMIRDVVLAGLPSQVKGDFPDAFIAMHPKAIGAVLKEALSEGFQEGFQEGFPEGFQEPPVRASSTLHPPPSSSNPSAKASPSPSPSPDPERTTGEQTVTRSTNPEEDHPPNPERTAALAIEHMARCDLRQAQAAGEPIKFPDRWLTKATATRRAAHHDQLLANASARPDADPVTLAEELDAACGPDDGGLARAKAEAALSTQAAADGAARRAEYAAWLEQSDAAIAALSPEQLADLEARATETNPTLRRMELRRLALDPETTAP